MTDATTSPRTAAIALGSNLGDRAANLCAAIGCLQALGTVEAVSTFHDTAPVGYTDQPRFLNAALLLTTTLAPVALMQSLLDIEHTLGRDRTTVAPKGPRTIDLDLLLVDDRTHSTPRLTLPHPEMHTRRFVLGPLAEIAPQMLHPTTGRTIQQLLDTLLASSHSPAKSLALLLSLLLIPLALPGQATQHYDLLIRNGHIVDGTGSPWYAGDIAILGGRIARIEAPGTIPAAAAAGTIDAQGLTVTPGFIDMLGQSERTILRDPHVPSKIFQGVTTEITGEGNSIAPASAAMLAANPALTAQGQPPVAFPSFAVYFTQLERQGIALNFASYVGATTVRRIVLGEEDRAPTPVELAAMQQLVADAMHQGAVGLSTSLMYAPAPYAHTEELIALARTAAANGGIYATHMRSEADGIFPALDETFRIAREAHIPVEIFHLKLAGQPNWGQMAEVVRRIDAARAAGLDIAADTYAYTVSGNPFSAFVPPWTHGGGDVAMVARLRDPVQRLRIRDSILHDRTWDNEWFMIQGPQDIRLSSTDVPSLQTLRGQTLTQIAAARGTDPIDTLMDLLAEDPKLGVLLATMSEADVELALKQPWVSVGMDAPGTSPLVGHLGGHPRAYATFPHILRRYVREDGLLTLPEAIRKFTALPAARLHLADRGVLKVGLWADIAIFDPAKFKDVATFEDPSQLAVGMEYVLVNGVPVLAAGQATPALPGKVLRGPGYTPSPSPGH